MVAPTTRAPGHATPGVDDRLTTPPDRRLPHPGGVAECKHLLRSPPMTPQTTPRETKTTNHTARGTSDTNARTRERTTHPPARTGGSPLFSSSLLR
jgi:hypothetical protein